MVFVCFSKVENLPPCLFFILSILIFFLIPLAILIFLYTLIAKTLIDHPNIMAPKSSNPQPTQSVIKYRKQVVLMLGTVVVAFFICLLPFRALTLWIIIVPAESIMKIGLENYYNLLYFSRIMFHINSAINPILYNVMSSKFRGGFLRLCGLRVFRRRLRKMDISRKSTHSSSTTTHTTSSSQHTSESMMNNRCSSVNGSRRVEQKQRGVRETYVRIPLQIVGGVAGEQIPNEEIYV